MHTMGPDAQNLLELVRGYLAAETQNLTPTPACPLSTLGIDDLLSVAVPDGPPVTVRNLVVLLEEVGRSSPYLADIFAGHYGVTLAGLIDQDAQLPAGSFSVNDSHANATNHLVVVFETASITINDVPSATTRTSLSVAFTALQTALSLCHSAALLGTLARIRDALDQPLHSQTLKDTEEAVRALVQAAADRHDHALGRGPYRDTQGFGGRYDNALFTSVARRSALAYLDLLIGHSEPPLADALSVLYGRAVTGFGAPTQTTMAFEGRESL